MLTELIIFAVVLVTLNLLASILMAFIAVKVMFSDKIVNWYMEKIVDMTASMQEKLDDYDL